MEDADGAGFGGAKPETKHHHHVGHGVPSPSGGGSNQQTLTQRWQNIASLHGKSLPLDKNGKPKRSHKKGQGIKARLAAEAAGLPWPPPGVGRGNRKNPSNGVASGILADDAVHHNANGGKRSPTTHRRDAEAFAAARVNPGDPLGLLSRKLEALQSRVVPLAIAATSHLRKQLVSGAAAPTPRERSMLLSEMASLQRMLTSTRPIDVRVQSAKLGPVPGVGDETASFGADMAMEQQRVADADAAATLDTPVGSWDQDHRGGLDPVEVAMLQNENPFMDDDGMDDDGLVAAAMGHGGASDVEYATNVGVGVGVDDTTNVANLWGVGCGDGVGPGELDGDGGLAEFDPADVLGVVPDPARVDASFNPVA